MHCRGAGKGGILTNGDRPPPFQAEPAQMNVFYSLLPNCSFYARSESTTASAFFPRTNCTSVMPSTFRNCSAGTFIGPGESALPGAGCGNAVDAAVWNVTLPSTFCMIWWMWPFSTVTDPKLFM